MALLDDSGAREEQFSSHLAMAINCTHTNHTVEMLECLQEADVGIDISLLESLPQNIFLRHPTGGTQ